MGVVESYSSKHNNKLILDGIYDYLLPANSCVIHTLQLDLKLEAKNLLKFQDLMNGYENIKFPTPITPYVTNSVLVESFEVNIIFLLHGISPSLVKFLSLWQCILCLSLYLVWSPDL